MAMTVELETRLTAPDNDGSVLSNGHILALSTPPAVSTYLQYLPAPYQLDSFVGRFLLIFESILGPIEQTIDTLASYFDPRLAPEEILPWLASWLRVELDQNWPIERRRELILHAGTLYRWRGTRRGLREHLRLYTGRTPLIVENFDGMRLGHDAVLGLNTRIGDTAARPHSMSITVFTNDLGHIDERVVRQIVEVQKPAHADYTLEIRVAEGEAS